MVANGLTGGRKGAGFFATFGSGWPSTSIR
jgi:hypothetical protein